jgi:phospholipid/cholesterol/gamma-HCH transport system substrate-binding protein
MEERRERAQRVRVGVFVLLALGAFLGMVYALGARARLFEPRFTIHAEFTEVGGLAEGATVRLAGVQIGRVTGVHLPRQPGGKVRVDLTIGRQFADRIRRDSVARIETQGLLGDKIIEISVGSAAAPPLGPGELLASRDPADLAQVISGSVETVRHVAALAESLRQTAAAFNESRVLEDLAATAAAARRTSEHLSRLTAQVERGRGWAHALLYEEPVALRRLNQLLASTQALVDRLQRAEGALGVLTSPEGGRAARRLVAALERVGQLADRAPEAEGLLPALLFDPAYRGVADDVRTVARNLRDISERVAGGRGTLGSLVADPGEAATLRAALEDFRVATANLRAITTRIQEGEGTLGALITDPTVYERLAAILDGVQRSAVLRWLIRRLGRDGDRRE